MSDQLNYLNPDLINNFIKKALEEDLGPGDYSTLAAIDDTVEGRASLIIKENGVLPISSFGS